MDQITNSDFRAWFQVTRAIESDRGYFVEFRNRDVIVDGVVQVGSWASARELMSEVA